MKTLGDIYPVKYNIWSNKKGFTRTLPEGVHKEEIYSRIEITCKEANPVDGGRTPWVVMLPSQFKKTEAIRGMSEWVQGRKGITTDLNGIYMVNILDHDTKNNKVLIETRPEAGKRSIALKSKKYWIEPDLLFPLLKGAGDFSTCYVKPKKNLYVIVPNSRITKKHLLEAEDRVKCQLPRIQTYFNDYKKLLATRSTYKARLRKYAYYMIYNVGSYTFEPYKVIWAEQSSKFEAAVITGKDMPLNGFRPYVPDHKIYFADFKDKNKAYYLCGLLAAPLVREFVESHTISIQRSNIFKHMNLPEYQKSQTKHKTLARLVETAHRQDDNNKRQDLIDNISVLAEDIIFS